MKNLQKWSTTPWYRIIIYTNQWSRFEPILYGVETKVLKQAVRRNIDRFPSDFMFELTKDEFNNLRSQIVTSSWGGAGYWPFITGTGLANWLNLVKYGQFIN